jgi:hypothetical protein
MVAAAERADNARLAELQKRSDAVGISEYLRELLLQ